MHVYYVTWKPTVDTISTENKFLSSSRIIISFGVMKCWYFENYEITLKLLKKMKQEQMKSDNRLPSS